MERMLKKVPWMRKKHAEPMPGSPVITSNGGGEATTAADAPSSGARKKTGKRGSVFNSLFGAKPSPKPNFTETGAEERAPSNEVLLVDAAPSPLQPETHVHSPSPKREAGSKDSAPPALPPRKGSKDDEPSSPGLGLDKESTVFDVSDRKEPSRSRLRTQGSRKELMANVREQVSRKDTNSNNSGIFTASSRPNGSSRVGDKKGEKHVTIAIGSPVTSRYIQSARLPALTIDNNDALSVNSFLSAQQMLESKPRAESDPCPIYASTLEDDFGFTDETDGNVQILEDDDDLLPRTNSFQKPRTPSFNYQERSWEGRRSLQLSINNKDVTSGAPGTVHVSAATLDRLVEYVVSSNEFMEASQVSGFLLTYHSYVNSQGLLAALASRYDVSTSNKDQVARIRTLYVLQRWIEEHWYDFESDDILLMGVVQFASSRLASFPEKDTVDPCSGLLKKLASVQDLAKSKFEKRRLESVTGTLPLDDDDDKKLDESSTPGVADMGGAAVTDEAPQREHGLIAPRLLKHQSRLLIKLEKAPPLDLPRDFETIWKNKLEGKPMHVILSHSVISKVETARQMTVIEHNLYKRIPPTELIAQATKQLAKPPEHVRAMIAHFNDVTKFVAFSICSFTDLAPRTYMLRKWIKIGRECLRLNNYNAVFEIMAGIHSVAVHRLHKTRGSLNARTKNILEKLEEVTSRKNNYATYRTLLAQNTVPIQPAVPFIGATLTDLSFLDFGHRNVVENGEGDTLINFTKHRRVAQVMGTIKKFQDHPFLLDTAPELHRFLQNELAKASEINDKELYRMSLVCEPAAQTAGGQAQVAFFDFEVPVGSNPAANNHKREESRAAFLFGGFKKN